MAHEPVNLGIFGLIFQGKAIKLGTDVGLDMLLKTSSGFLAKFYPVAGV